jgi:peptide-methionine (S)-S-oxide reductase
MQEKAVFAGGCFWGMEELFRRLPGVVSTTVGYTGGHVTNPTYEQVVTKTTGHAEAIEIIYDPARISYEKLLKFFFQMHDPTTPGRQGNDIGPSYRSAIFYADAAQKATAQQVMRQVEASGKWPGPLATELAALSVFWPAEAYHQDYLQREPDGYSCHFIRPDWTLD